MKLKSTLLAATLTAFTASAIYADEDFPEREYYWKGEAQTLKMSEKKPAKKRRHAGAKSAMPATDMDRQSSVKGAARDAQAKEKREKEGCEKTLSC